LKENEYIPFRPEHVQAITKQTLTAIAFIHNMKMAHTDIKPENILLLDDATTEEVDKKTGQKYLVPVNPSIKVIDFGNARFLSKKKGSLINTRQYRAPEVLLGIGWMFPSDVWSVACVIVETCQVELHFV
jgi:dual-specificity kinase